MKKPRTLRRRVTIALLIAGIYPLLVLAYTWSCVLRLDLKGGRHGPLDAYRHALASSVVSYTIGRWAVNLITSVFESGGKASHNMDRHNNRIGAGIGAGSRSFGDLERAVSQAVENGTVNTTDPQRITWMTENQWHDGRFW